MTEAALEGEDHGGPGCVAGFDGIVVVDGSSGLDDCGDALAGRGFDCVREGEESV